MNDQTDSQLLCAYAEHRSEPAFAELVRRHVDLVYSAALRMVCDSHLAEDVTQGVFVALARNVAQLTDRPVLSGWLHRTAQNIAAQTVRTDVRRRAREQEAAAMNELLAAESDASWQQIAPHLDTALGELTEPDRDALLLRYFERKSAREMAQTLGITDEAAQKRVTRAVERLREFFAKRGVIVGASGLVVVISANAVQAAPVGLALAISAAAALAGTAVVTAATATTTKAIAMSTLQKTLIAATITAAVGTGIYEARQVSKLQSQVETFQHQQAPLAEQIQQLTKDRDEATRQLAASHGENERLNRNTAELLRLRGEVTRLKSAARISTQLEEDEVQAQWAAWVSEMRTNVVKPEDAAYLVQALTNKATRIRLESTWAMRNIGLQRLFDTNLTSQTDLERQDLELQRATKIVVPGLVKALKDSDTLVRANAALTLGFLREELDVIVPALAAALNDQENRVALSAAKALGRFQTVATNAIPALLQAAHSSDEARRDAAINALKQIDPEFIRKAGLD